MSTERQGVSTPARGAAAAPGAKWNRRASMDPFAGSSGRVVAAFSTDENDENDAFKENSAPANSPKKTTFATRGVVMTPTMVRRRKSTGGDGARSAVAVVNVITKSNATTTTTTGVRANAITASLLGKRPRGPSPTTLADANANKMARLSASSEEEKDANDEPATQRTLLFANDHDAEADETTDDGRPRNVLIVNDFERVAELAFGAVAVGDRKSLLITLQNPSQVGNARIKYDGYIMSSATREPPARQTIDPRFKCDLHVCTVPAERKASLRITFEPKQQDINQELVATLRFTVNDRFRLQCHVSGSGVPAVSKAASLRERMATAPQLARSRRSLDHHSVLATSDMRRVARTPKRQSFPLLTPADEDDRIVTYPIESVMSSGVKRRESVALVVSPPRHRKTKKMRLEEEGEDIVTGASAATGGFHGSWWEKRKTLSDEEWMQRQEEGFTKWMNFVLVDSMGDDEQEAEAATAVIIEHPHRTPSRGRRRKSRIDFSSLRVLAMKRMESMWSRAAMEIYRSDEVTEAAANLKNEISEGKLVVRRDRPAYADVGLQAELIELLNNYHPVWLCLALETVLGHRIMAQEKCSLRSVMNYCAQLAEKNAANKKKNGEADKLAEHMPRQLKRVVLNYLVRDPHVAKHHRLVKNLKTPVEGGTLRVGKANPTISGRHYFDALMDAFAFKFFMVVLLLDRAAAHRSDKFVRFPCLFRVQPAKSKKATTVEDEAKHIKHSQGMVAEFCRLFLSKEGRIDKHMKQLGYSVSFQQVPLDEVDLEITNLAVDLRDGVRLARLLETLTAAPKAAATKSLSSFLRVPALSRLQKVHNVEICLHFLQEKCGRDFLESIRTSSGHVKTTGRLSFATLRDKEDAKLVETMAKAVVDGHRERTLALLWKLISVFQLRSLVNVDRLTKEIDNIKQRMSFRSMEFYQSSSTRRQPSTTSPEENQGLDEDVRELLLEWCRAVCANYFVRVSDFSESFADGRALCFLLHYYHPMLLTKSQIRLTTAEYATGSRAIHSANDLTKALENERRHFTLVNDRVKQLGEVPVLLPEQYDSMNPPDDKVIVTFVCYLQSRLMDSSREIHAAARLKRWWRSPRMRLVMRRKKNQAARTIQRFWYTSSVKRLAIRRCRRLLQAGRMVAAYMCAWLDRSRFLRLRHAVLALQRAFRRRILVGSSSSIATLVAAVKLQRTWQRHSLRQSVQLSICKREVCKRIVRHMAASRIQNVLKQNVVEKKEQREAKRVYQEMLETQRFEAGKKTLLKKVHARCARVVQSAAKAFIVHRRQCHAATKVQASWRGFTARIYYFRTRWAVLCIQDAVREWILRREEEARQRFQAMLVAQDREQKLKVLRGKVERRCASSIQSSWRSFVVQKQCKAATKVQCLFRGIHAKKLLGSLKSERDFSAAVVVQKHVRRLIAQHRYLVVRKGFTHLQAAARGVFLRTHVINFARFRQKARVMRVKMAKWKIEEWASRIAHVRMTNSAAATTLQKTWRMRAAVKHFSLMRQSVIRIQALVRGVQSRRYHFSFAQFRAKMERTRLLLAAWTIAHWSRKQLVRCHQQRYEAAVMIQASVRMWSTRYHYLTQREAAVKIQSRVRGMLSREKNLNFAVFQWRAEVSKKRMALWRIQSWVLRCVQRHRRAHAATVIQKNVRMAAKRAQFVVARSAAIKVQARFRGKLYRACVFDYGVFKATQVRCEQKMALWKIEEWILRVVHARRIQASSATCIQTSVRRFLARAQYSTMRHAAVKIQKIVRGVQSRQYKHDHAAFRERRFLARRSALITAKWTQLSFNLLRTRLDAVDAIARSWTSYKLRETIRNRVQWTAVCNAVASHLQSWWRGVLLQRTARRELQGLRFQRAKQMEREQAERAVTRIQLAWRSSVGRAHDRYRRQCLVKMREFFAAARICNAVFERLVRRNREKRDVGVSARRIQSWWRGMLVRLHEKREAVTQQRKKLAVMTLVHSSPVSKLQTGTTETSRSHASSAQGQHHESAQQPLTLGDRLEMALHMLLHGKRLQEMLFASHTIEMCTRYSKECAWKCVELKIYNTIFAAIRGLNRSRPHVELLHQLLLVLVNLTSFQRKDAKASPEKVSAVDQDDLRAVDALVDLLHVHRDMHVVFVLASRILKHYLLVLKPHMSTCEQVFHQWSETHRRLRGLHELLHKKMQVAAWAAKLPATPSKSVPQTPNATNPNANVMAKINPKTAVSVVAQLLKIIE